MSTAELFKKYLLTDCRQFMSSAVKILLKNILRTEIKSLKAKVEHGMPTKRTRQEPLPKPERKFTFLVQYPAPGRLYVDLLPYMLLNISAAGTEVCLTFTFSKVKEEMDTEPS